MNGIDGDDIGIYRDGVFHRPGYTPLPYGDPVDIPIAGDWNGGGGVDHIGVYRPDDRTFYRPGLAAITYGDPDDQPIAGDWRNPGLDRIGVYRPSNSTFYPYLS